MNTTKLISDILATADNLDMLLLELAKTDPFDANIEESQDFVDGIKVNIKGYKSRLNAPYVPHEHNCQCDSCRAAASDLAHDRHVDNELIRK